MVESTNQKELKNKKVKKAKKAKVAVVKKVKKTITKKLKVKPITKKLKTKKKLIVAKKVKKVKKVPTIPKKVTKKKSLKVKTNIIPELVQEKKSAFPEKLESSSIILVNGKSILNVPKPKKKKITKKEKYEKIENKRTKKQTGYQQFTEDSMANQIVDKYYKEKLYHTKTFSRCANIRSVRKDLLDSRWSNKVKKGGEDSFGLLGFQKLGSCRGKDFRKEKTKLKNREFQGSMITYGNNLIDLD